jgi:hypothetical protein
MRIFKRSRRQEVFSQEETPEPENHGLKEGGKKSEIEPLENCLKSVGDCPWHCIDAAVRLIEFTQNEEEKEKLSKKDRRKLNKINITDLKEKLLGWAEISRKKYGACDYIKAYRAATGKNPEDKAIAEVGLKKITSGALYDGIDALVEIQDKQQYSQDVKKATDMLLKEQIEKVEEIEKDIENYEKVMQELKEAQKVDQYDFKEVHSILDSFDQRENGKITNQIIESSEKTKENEYKPKYNHIDLGRETYAVKRILEFRKAFGIKDEVYSEYIKSEKKEKPKSIKLAKLKDTNAFGSIMGFFKKFYHKKNK